MRQSRSNHSPRADRNVARAAPAPATSSGRAWPYLRQTSAASECPSNSATAWGESPAGCSRHGRNVTLGMLVTPVTFCELRTISCLQCDQIHGHRWNVERRACPTSRRTDPRRALVTNCGDPQCVCERSWATRAKRSFAISKRRRSVTRWLKHPPPRRVVAPPRSSKLAA